MRQPPQDIGTSFKVRSNISSGRYGYEIAKSGIQHIYDFILFPLRCLLPYRWVRSMKLTDLGRERRMAVIPHLDGKILDVGCGPLDELRNEYVHGSNIIRTDVVQWGNVDPICSAEALPFKQESLNTVLMLACLNHVRDKKVAIKEAHRVLKRNGEIIITMINPFWGLLVHKLVFWFDYDRERGIAEGEEYGLTKKFVMQLLHSSGFKNVKTLSFLYGLNKLYIGEKA